MTKAQILIVEDDGIVAEDIKNCLKNLGFAVVAIVGSGEKAIETVRQSPPDLVLMDIMINGNMDGIEAAEQLRAQYHLPVVYLTSYTDEKILEKAKITEPSGYVIKPFEERELHIAIEMALYKHQMAQKLREQQKWLSTTLNSIGDAVITTDTSGNIIYMNPVARRLTHLNSEKEYIARPLDDIFHILHEDTEEPAENPVIKVIRDGKPVSTANHYLLRIPNSIEIPIENSASPIQDEKGNMTGVVLVLRDVSERKRSEKALRESEAQKQAILDGITSHIIFVNENLDIIWGNKAAAQFAGKSPEEMVGRKCYEFRRNDASHPCQNCPTQKTFISQKTEQVTLDAHNGQIWDIKGEPVFDNKGKLIGVVDIASDITEKIRAEEALCRAYEVLEMEVEKQTFELLKANEQLIREANERKRTEIEKETLLYQLKERVKELNCLYSLSKLIDQQPDIPIDKLMEETVKLLPPAWQYPDITCARILFENKIFKTDNFRITPWKQSSDINIYGKNKGCAEVFYLKEKPELCEGPFMEEEKNLLADIAVRLGKFLERRYAEQEVIAYQAQLRALSSQLLLTEERERKRIATELHDRIGQAIAISKLRLGMLRETVSSPEIIYELDDIRELMDQTIEDTRTLTFEISPPVLHKLGLEPAIEWFVEQVRYRHGIQIEFIDDNFPKPTGEELRVLIFRAARELILNIVKHAHARTAKVSVKKSDNNIRIEVEDDGVGFIPSQIKTHPGMGNGFGLFSIRERLSELGGQFEIDSYPGKGTRVLMISPLDWNDYPCERKAI